MNYRASATLGGVSVLLVLFLVPTPATAQTAVACPPTPDITDPNNDHPLPQNAVPDSVTNFNEVDLVTGCIAETEASIAVILTTAAAADASTQQRWVFNAEFTKADGSAFKATRTDEDATVTTTPTGVTSAQSGTTITFTIPKTVLGMKPGAPLTNFFLSSTGRMILPQEVVTTSDRAPNTGAAFGPGAPYKMGARAPPTLDSDQDGSPDRYEIENGTNPDSIDSDFDGLLDGNAVEVATGSEAYTNYTNAGILRLSDDGVLATFAGEMHFGTNATNPDTDADGLLDGATITTPAGSNASVFFANRSIEPLVPGSDPEEYLGEFTFDANPIQSDTDQDGIPDRDEVTGTGNPFQNASHFPDFPGSTDPADADTDADGLNDLDERTAGTNPTEGDTDLDGVTDGTEVAGGMNPLNPDTDGDGTNDGDEVRLGTDPKDPTSKPVTETEPAAAEGGYAILSVIGLLAVILLCVVGILVRWG